MISPDQRGKRGRRWRLPCCCVVLAACSALARAVHAQPPQTAGSTCAMGLQELARLDGRDPVMPDVTSLHGMTADSQGRLWVSFGSVDGPWVLTREGKPIGSPFRKGEGPAEYLGPWALVPVGDSVAVFDALLNRMTLVGPDLVAVRSARVVGQFFSGLAVDWPFLLLNGIVPTPSSAGLPFHLLNAETGEIERSFGGDSSGQLGPLDHSTLFGSIVQDPVSGEVWTVLRSRPLVQRWSAKGEALGSGVVELPWFPAGGRARVGSPTRAPDPQIISVVHDGVNLRLLAQVPASNWRAAWSEWSGHVPGGGVPSPDLLYQGRLVTISATDLRVAGECSLGVVPVLAGPFPNSFLTAHGFGTVAPYLAVQRLRGGDRR